MKKLSVILAMFAFTGLTNAAFAKSNFTNKEISVKVRNAAAKKGIAVDRVHSKGLGYTETGKFRRALSENQNGQVREWLVGKNGTALRNTKLANQSTERGTANLNQRRERNGMNNAGTFSGVNSSGLSRSGKSYRMNSATDRTESNYQSVKTGARVTATK